MSALDKVPTNTNYLAKHNFRFMIKKLPNVNFFCQAVNIPGFSVQNVDEGNPFVKIPYSGDHIDYQPLNVTFLVDEDMQNYLEIYNWIRGLGFPDEFGQYKALAEKPKYSGEGLKSEVSVFVLTNAKNALYNVVFSDAFPIAISSIDFSSVNSETQYATVTATFKYTSFQILHV